MVVLLVRAAAVVAPWMAEQHCSVIVPILNEAAVLEQRLAAIRRWCTGHELIVVDGGSHDGSWDIAARFADTLICAPRGRARQMNAGASRAEGDWLLFLHCDSIPQFDLMTLIERLSGSDWGFCDARPQPAGGLLHLVGKMMWLRSRLSSVATGDQMLCIRRSRFEQVDGYADISLMEDVELSKRLRETSKPAAMPLRIHTDSRRWQRYGVIKTILLMWRLRFDYWRGKSPASVAKRYQSAPGRAPAVLVQFAREPVPGQVKTRLQPHLSAEQACALHRDLLSHTLTTLSTIKTVPGQLWIDAEPADSQLAELASEQQVELKQQAGNDLGERMAGMFADNLQHYERVVLVGSDAPGIDSDYLKQALDALHDYDLVLGPATDGGYVLIGLRVMAEELFRGIEWGGSSVLEATLVVARKLQLSVHCLEEKADVDRPEDLRHVPDSLGLSVGL